MPFGLYVHIPFCPQHCPYCAFTVLTGHKAFYQRYVDAVCTEIRSQSAYARKGPLQTLFFGGGTPSMLAPEHIAEMLMAARHTFGFAASIEITLEANPGWEDAAKFQAFHALGCTRLSLGVQAFHDDDLRILGRRHRTAEALAAYHTARQAGFMNINLDVIFSIPGVPRQHWQSTVQTLLDVAPEHISTYAMTIEEGTHFARRHHQGRLTPVSEEDDAWAYAWAIETLTAAGYEHYEVSNFARPGYRSHHNWGYWHGAEYLGVGISAHSFLDGQRRWNICNLQAYLQAVEAGQSPQEGMEELAAHEARHERLWLQLRTCEGALLTATEIHRLYQQHKFQAMLTSGLIQLCDERLLLRPAGRFLADAIAADIVTFLEES